MRYTHRDLPWLVDTYFQVINPVVADEFFKIIQEIRRGMQKTYEGVIVQHGEIIVDTIDLVIDEPNVKVWQGDCRSKYMDYAYSSDPLQLMLFASERTLYLDDRYKGEATFIDTGLSTRDGWSLVVECARYSIYMVAYRVPEEFYTRKYDEE
jgi:hypothetical protein